MKPQEIEDLRASLRSISQGFRQIGAHPGAWIMAEFVLRQGVAYIAQALPLRYKRRVPRQCFTNTRNLLRRARLTYVEGFVSTSRIPFPVHHAWAINSFNEVIDPTISCPQDCAYIGVAFSREDYANLTRGSRSASVMVDEIGRVRIDFMLARCPALQELMPTETCT